MRILTILLISILSLNVYAEAKISQHTLKNGMKVVVKEDNRAPVAVSFVWYNVGSADEPGGITGLSHALEHLMFKGTAKYPQGEFSKTIAALGGQENAFTNYDYTAYFEKVSVDNIETIFRLEADRMKNLLLDATEFNKEMKVIREERRLRTDDNPQALTFEQYMATANLSAPYNHPIVGWMSDLEQLQVDDARKWYEKYYAPNNATLVVVGDVKPKEIFTLAEKYFGGIKKGAIPKRKAQQEPPARGKKYVEVNANAQVPMLMFGYNVPSLPSSKDKKDAYILEVIAGLLDAGEHGRLAKNIVRGTQTASNVGVYYNLYARYPTQFIFFAVPTRDISLAKLQADILNEIKKLKTKIVDAGELKRIKTQIIAQKTFEKDSIFGQAMEIGLLETVGLGYKAAAQYTQNIDEVTPEDIQKVARKYFKEKSLTTARLIPLKKEEKPQ